MQLIRNQQAPPDSFTQSIFLAGPTHRDASLPSWRTEAIEILESLGFDGVVFIPEGPLGEGASYEDQIAWETLCLDMSDCVLFWVPRDLKTLPGFTTNVEWGEWKSSGKVVLGFPESAPKMRYLASQAVTHTVPVSHTLEGTLKNAMTFMQKPSIRHGGERNIPLVLWHRQEFQGWYHTQISAGNRLDKAVLQWVLRVGPKGGPLKALFWVLWVDIHVTSEGRNKSNEFIFQRPDIAAVVAFHAPTKEFFDTKIVLVREFRPSGRAPDGYVWEIPGGSPPLFKDFSGNYQQLSHDEFLEETGLDITQERFLPIGSRQPLAALSTHLSRTYMVELTAEEIGTLSKDTAVHGENDEERTTVHIRPLSWILRTACLSWSDIGMILAALYNR